MFMAYTILGLGYGNNQEVISWYDAYGYDGMLDFGIRVLKASVLSFYYIRSSMLDQCFWVL